MPFRCKAGTVKGFRFRTTAIGKKQRLGGCMRKGRFVKVKEVKTFKKGVK